LERDNWPAGRINNPQEENTIRVTLDEDLHIWFGGCGGMRGRCSSPVQSEAAPEYRQFDFWVGDWDAFDFDNPSTKRAARPA
jgi:hypothetical protein